MMMEAEIDLVLDKDWFAGTHGESCKWCVETVARAAPVLAALQKELGAEEYALTMVTTDHQHTVMTIGKDESGPFVVILPSTQAGRWTPNTPLEDLELDVGVVDGEEDRPVAPKVPIERIAEIASRIRGALSGERTTNELSIDMFIHCGLCVKERPSDESPQSYSKLDVGFTPAGLQVWCRRHSSNVMHVDFEKQKHPANTTRRKS